MSTFYYKPLSKLILFSDFVVLNTALLFAHYLIFHYANFSIESELFFLLSNTCWLIISMFNRNYRFIQPMNFNYIIDKFLMTLICQLLIVLGIIYFFKILDISKELVVISFGLFFLLNITHRVLLYFFLKKSSYSATRSLKAKVIGDKYIAESLMGSIDNNSKTNYELAEYISDDQVKRMQHDTLLNKLLINNPDEIFVCYKEVSTGLLERLIVFGNINSIKIKVVFDLINSKKENAINYKSAPIVHINPKSVSDLKVKVSKRCFDVLFAFTTMTLGLPVFVTIYFITKFTSKGPVFYKQERIGKNEKPFFIYKFRSMHVDAEKFGPQLAKENDPRVTKWGLIMRKTRLDELPQFWNVLKSDMSIVGHRPERKHFIEEISKKTPDYKKLLSNKPGITSLGQVHYGYAENVDQMCERLNYDLLYTHNVNFNSDIKIIFKTVKIMAEGRGK